MKSTKPGVTVALKSPSVFLSLSLFRLHTFLPPVLARSLPLSLIVSLPSCSSHFRFPCRPTVSSLLSQCVRTGGINYWPSAACSPTTTTALIEGINEWSACEMIWCHGSRSTVCEGGKLGEGLFDQSCITNSVLPQRQSKQFTCPCLPSLPANHL